MENNVCTPNVFGLEHCFHITLFREVEGKDHTKMEETCCWCGKVKNSWHGKKLPETFRSMESFQNRFFPNEKRT